MADEARDGYASDQWDSGVQQRSSDGTLGRADGAGSGGRHGGEGFVGSMRNHAREMADEQKDVGAQKIDDVAGAVHEAADAVAPHMQGAADYIHDAAQNLTRLSSALRQRSIEDVLSDVNRFARAQPAAFFGVSVLAGLALTRFLKSSSPPGAHAASAASNRPGEMRAEGGVAP